MCIRTCIYIYIYMEARSTLPLPDPSSSIGSFSPYPSCCCLSINHRVKYVSKCGEVTNLSHFLSDLRAEQKKTTR